VTEAQREASTVRWWHFKRRLNGKFWITMLFLISLILVTVSTLYRSVQGESITIEQLQDWRTETTTTWKATIEQMGRIEARQNEIWKRLERDKR
jgi:hypothetical protein